MDAFLQGLAFLGQGHILLLVLLGTVIGLMASVVPGIGSITALAVLLPVTFTMGAPEAFAFLLAITGGAGFAGSITAILLNLPGDGINAATTLDGYPMARQGKAGIAIGASAAASALGAVFGLLLLSLAIPIIRPFLLEIGPPEVFALSIAGVALIATVSRGSLVSGLISGLLGMAAGTIGLNVVAGTARFTGGSAALFDGVPLVAAVTGLFAIPELVRLLASRQTVNASGAPSTAGTWTGVMEVVRRPKALLRGSAIGAGIGALPGAGASISTWVAYFAEKNASKNPERFGRGAIEGVIAPEAANDAKDGGSMLPFFALGIPGGLTTAILLGAFVVQGIQPGPQMFEDHLDLIWLVILALLLSNILSSLLGLAAVRPLVKLTEVSPGTLAPIVFALAVVGSFVDGRTFTAIVTAVFFALFGLALMLLGYGRPPFIVGLVLLPIAERNFFISKQISGGSLDFLWGTKSLVILLVTLTAIAGPAVVQGIRKRRAAVPEPTVAVAQSGGVDAIAATATDPLKAVTAGTELQTGPDGEAALRGSPWELAALAMIAAVTAWYAYEAGQLSPDGAAFPKIIAGSLGVLVVVRLTQWARSRRQVAAAVRPRPLDYLTRWDLGFAIASVLVLPGVLWTLGMVPGVGVYAAVFYLVYNRTRSLRSLVTAAALGLGCAAAIYYMFTVLLDITLPASGLF